MLDHAVWPRLEEPMMMTPETQTVVLPETQRSLGVGPSYNLLCFCSEIIRSNK